MRGVCAITLGSSSKLSTLFQMLSRDGIGPRGRAIEFLDWDECGFFMQIECWSSALRKLITGSMITTHVGRVVFITLVSDNF